MKDFVHEPDEMVQISATTERLSSTNLINFENFGLTIPKRCRMTKKSISQLPTKILEFLLALGVPTVRMKVRNS